MMCPDEGRSTPFGFCSSVFEVEMSKFVLWSTLQFDFYWSQKETWFLKTTYTIINFVTGANHKMIILGIALVYHWRINLAKNELEFVSNYKFRFLLWDPNFSKFLTAWAVYIAPSPGCQWQHNCLGPWRESAEGIHETFHTRSVQRSI